MISPRRSRGKPRTSRISTNESTEYNKPFQTHTSFSLLSPQWAPQEDLTQTKSYHPTRGLILAGHQTDVSCVKVHPHPWGLGSMYRREILKQSTRHSCYNNRSAQRVLRVCYSKLVRVFSLSPSLHFSQCVCVITKWGHRGNFRHQPSLNSQALPIHAFSSSCYLHSMERIYDQELAFRYASPSLPLQ